MKPPIRTYKTILHGQEVTVKVYEEVRVSREIELPRDAHSVDFIDRTEKQDTKDLLDIFEELNNYDTPTTSSSS